jgi:NAD dependent epimerase/dehydratase
VSGQKVLVTGAGGFIGSHLVETLLRQGREVRAFVHYNGRGFRGWLDELDPSLAGGLDVMAGDICDPFGVADAVRGCDTVLHLAALIAIPYSYHSPASYVDVNITGTLNVLQAARSLGVRRVVHTSTSEVYGTARYVPIDEEHPLQGQSPYSATKIGADQLALSFYRSFDVPVTICRPFNTYGPRQSARALIPTIISQICAGERRLKLGALTPTRDFNYVQDTVDGFIALAQANGVDGEVVNLGMGVDVSVETTARLIAELSNVDIEFDQQAERLRPARSEVERLQASNEKARALAGWAPKYAGVEGLKRGLAHTIDWFSVPGRLAQYRPSEYNI